MKKINLEKNSLKKYNDNNNNNTPKTNQWNINRNIKNDNFTFQMKANKHYNSL